MPGTYGQKNASFYKDKSKPREIFSLFDPEARYLTNTLKNRTERDQVDHPGKRSQNEVSAQNADFF